MTVQESVPAVNPVLAEKLEKLLGFHQERLEYERRQPDFDRNGRPLSPSALENRKERINFNELGIDVCLELLGRKGALPYPNTSSSQDESDDSLVARYAERAQDLTPEMRERIDKLKHRVSTANIMAIFSSFDEPLSVDVVWMEYHLRFRKGIPRSSISDKLSRMITGEDAVLEPVPELGRGHYRKRVQRRLKVVR